MKQFMKRGLALLLAFVLVIGLAPQLLLPADSASYVANWGYRGVTATSLSGYANSFYTSGNTYEDFISLSGSATLSSVPGSSLYKELKDFMIENHDYTTNYAATRYLFMYTDCIGGDTGKLSTFYIGKLVNSTWDSGNTYNREHTWPQSKGADKDTPIGGDLMALRPTNPSANSSRGNKPFGEGSGYVDPSVYFDNKNYSGMDKTVDVRGDCARAVLYTYVRWGLTNLSDVFQSVDVLLKWMKEDPVDTWELGRNDAVQSVTGTRNVFIDYPELAFALFGREIPADMVTPSGKAQSSNKVKYTVIFSENGVTVSGPTEYAEDALVTMPAATVAVPCGWSFAGWTLFATNNETSAPAVRYAVGEQRAAADLAVSGTTAGVVSLYTREENGTTYYTTEATANHSMQPVAGQASTCLTAGWNAYSKCANCDYAEGYAELPLAEHTFSTSDTGPEKNYICGYCGGGYKTYRVSFLVDFAEISAPAAVECVQDGTVALPELAAPDGYSFRGWRDEDGNLHRAAFAAGKPVTLTAEFTKGFAIPGLNPGQLVEVDGTRYVADENGSLLLGHTDAKVLTAFAYNQSKDEDPKGIAEHQVYPTTMQVMTLHYDETAGAYTAVPVEALENIMTYQGTSIRMTGKPGIRIFTDIPQAKRSGLIDGSLLSGTALEGYRLVEYGTLFKWAKDVTDLVYDPAVNNRSVAYGNGVDAIFSRQNGNIRFTGMIVNLMPELCGDELLLRPYMVLQNAAGETVVIHGGTLQRNIGYVAYQNRTFKPNQAAADFIWNIIRAVYGEDFQG